MRVVKRLFDTPMLAPARDELSAFLFARWSQAMLSELAQIPVSFSGIEEIENQKVSFVVLQNQTKLYGKLPSDLERKIYRYQRHKIAPQLTEETIRVAIDVILRYLYPPCNATDCCSISPRATFFVSPAT